MGKRHAPLRRIREESSQRNEVFRYETAESTTQKENNRNTYSQRTVCADGSINGTRKRGSISNQDCMIYIKSGLYEAGHVFRREEGISVYDTFYKIMASYPAFFSYPPS